MRFDSLTIPAFGPFSDFRLQFESSKYDIHLIYGRNEAGKSSLLRAIDQLFFGFPHSTSDDFRHASKNLLIGAAVTDGDQSLTFYRRKGKANTLLDAERSSLADSALEPFLGAVNAEFFRSMFGLDTHSLRAGAADLLSGKGDLGTLLFSASLGGSPIDDAIKKLEIEANSLCKGASRKDTTILPAIALFRAAEKAAGSESTSASAWEGLKREIKRAEASFAEVNLRHRELRERGQFVEACLGALPVLNAIRQVESELAEIELPELPSDFSQRVRESQARVSRSQQSYQLQRSQIEKGRADLELIADPGAILSASGDFEMLHRRAEQYRENVERIPALEARLGETDLEKLPAVDPAEQALLKERGATLSELRSRSAEVARDLENLEIEIAGQTGGLGAASDLGELEEQVHRADKFAAELAAAGKLERDLAALESRRGILMARLGIEGDPMKLKVPGAKTMQAEARECERLRKEVSDLESRLADVRDLLTDEQSSLDHLASQAALYTPADLRASRKDRDARWQKMVDSDEVDPALGEAIERADEIADALHEHADQLATAAGHQGKITKLTAQRTNLEGDLKAAEEKFEDWSRKWRASSESRSPIELLEWREEWVDLCGLVEESGGIEASLRDLRAKEKALLDELGGEDFASVYRALKSDFKKANQEEGERLKIREFISKKEVRKEQLEREAAALAGDLEAAQQEWEESCASLGVDSGLPPAAAVEELAGRAQAREHLLDFQVRREAVADYRELLEATAARFQTEASEPVLARLYEGAKLAQAKAETLQEELARVEETFPQSKLAYEGEKAELQALIEQAGSPELESVILQLEARQGLKTRLAEQRSALQNFAGARPLAEFTALLEEQDGMALAEEKASLDQAEEALQAERDRSRAALDDLRRAEGKMMEASDRAATEKQAAADALATIVCDTTRFRQLHYAIDFLKQQVEDYRQKTQGPMIEKTSSFFQSLTGSAFEKVVGQLDEKGTPQLIAIRSGGEAVPTTGLSEGTADQLYLALRLAAIDLHLENHPPVPLILDDLLMTFDDERTCALLPVLEKLSEKTQILIFTHHGHLRELVGKKVAVHELRGRDGSAEVS